METSLLVQYSYSLGQHFKALVPALVSYKGKKRTRLYQVPDEPISHLCSLIHVCLDFWARYYFRCDEQRILDEMEDAVMAKKGKPSKKSAKKARRSKKRNNQKLSTMIESDNEQKRHGPLETETVDSSHLTLDTLDTGGELSALSVPQQPPALTPASSTDSGDTSSQEDLAMIAPEQLQLIREERAELSALMVPQQPQAPTIPEEHGELKASTVSEQPLAATVSSSPDSSSQELAIIALEQLQLIQEQKRDTAEVRALPVPQQPTVLTASSSRELAIVARQQLQLIQEEKLVTRYLRALTVPQQSNALTAAQQSKVPTVSVPRVRSRELAIVPRAPRELAVIAREQLQLLQEEQFYECLLAEEQVPIVVSKGSKTAPTSGGEIVLYNNADATCPSTDLQLTLLSNYKMRRTVTIDVRVLAVLVVLSAMYVTSLVLAMPLEYWMDSLVTAICPVQGEEPVDPLGYAWWNPPRPSRPAMGWINIS